MNICKIDSNRIFTGEVAILNPKSAIPKGWIAIDPPSDGIQQFNNDKWIELDEYPIVEVISVEPSRIISKVEFVETLISAGYAETLEAMLVASPASVRQAWYAYTSIDLFDARLIAFFNEAKVDLNTIFKK